ncbi:MAG TPA: hypothetical protein VNR89_04145 [Roseomonas sp.]|nr:hypothetical protein [Roseomonas sp.]
MPTFYRITAYDRRGRALRSTLAACVTYGAAVRAARELMNLVGGCRFAVEG